MSTTESLWRIGEIATAKNTQTGETFPVVRIKVGLGETWLSPHGRKITDAHEFTAHSELPQPVDAEPQGIGAVIEDPDGDYWVRESKDADEPWTRHGCANRSWTDLGNDFGPLEIIVQGIEDVA